MLPPLWALYPPAVLLVYCLCLVPPGSIVPLFSCRLSSLCNPAALPLVFTCAWCGVVPPFQVFSCCIPSLFKSAGVNLPLMGADVTWPGWVVVPAGSPPNFTCAWCLVQLFTLFFAAFFSRAILLWSQGATFDGRG